MHYRSIARPQFRRLDRAGRAWPALAWALLLGGCTGLSPAPEPQTIEASQSVIHFEHADYDPQRAEYLLRHDPRSANDVYTARFLGNDAFAMLVAYKTGPGFVIQERPTEAYVADLLTNDTELIWGETGRASPRMGSVPYRMFQIEGQPVNCVGFGQPRGETTDDRGRKSDLVFGFFCHSNARPLSRAAAEDLIGRVSLRGRR